MVVFTSDASCYFHFLKSEIKDWILEVKEKFSATEELTYKKSGFGVWWFRHVKIEMKSGNLKKVEISLWVIADLLKLYVNDEIA